MRSDRILASEAEDVRTFWSRMGVSGFRTFTSRFLRACYPDPLPREISLRDVLTRQAEILGLEFHTFSSDQFMKFMPRAGSFAIFLTDGYPLVCDEPGVGYSTSREFLHHLYKLGKAAEGLAVSPRLYGQCLVDERRMLAFGVTPEDWLAIALRSQDAMELSLASCRREVILPLPNIASCFGRALVCVFPWSLLFLIVMWTVDFRPWL